jgi:hypothetical protein
MLALQLRSPLDGHDAVTAASATTNRRANGAVSTPER